MTIDAPTTNLAKLNTCSAEAFTAHLGGVLENAVALVRRVADRRPFASPAALHRALMAEVDGLSEADLVAFLSGHPELAGAEARAGTMTANSISEQALLSLAQLSETEAVRWSMLNARYRERFGFPFIVRVAEHDYNSLLAVFEQRLGNDRQSELRIALAEITKISRHRLATKLDELNL